MKETGVNGCETTIIEKSEGLAQPAPPGVDKLKEKKKKKACKGRGGIKENSRAGQLVQAWRSQEAAFVWAGNKTPCVCVWRVQGSATGKPGNGQASCKEKTFFSSYAYPVLPWLLAKEAGIAVKPPNPREWDAADRTPLASPSHVLQNCQARGLRVKWGESRAKRWSVERKPLPVTGEGNEAATEGRAGPCGGTSALLDPVEL